MVRLARKIWGAIKGVFGRYEAAYQRWGERTWIPATVQDARIDADFWTRYELVRRHRYWVKNNGICQRIRNLFVQFSVGICGLDVIVNSADEVWNDARKANWLKWSEAPEVGSNCPLSQLEVQWAGALFDDGEVFIHLTEGMRDGRLGPMIQTIEAHRVQTPSNLRKEEGKTIYDGIRVDANLKPISYFVRIASSPDGTPQYTEIPAEEIVHLFKARRPGMLRGIPEGFSVMNDLHDLDDLQMFQMQKAKAAATITNVITNPAGELDPAALRKTRLRIQSQNADGTTAETKNLPNFYEVKLGANTIALRTGEDIKQFRQEEPGVVTQQYWDYLVSKICCAYNVPKLLVTPYSLQGTVTRADLDVCTNAFRANFEIIRWGLEQIYRWQTRWAVRFDRSLDGKLPADFLNVVIRPPRAPNVDIGRNAQALILELRAGTVTYQDIYAERQQDWREQFRQAAEAAAYLKQLATEFDVEVEEIAQKLEQSASKPEPEGDEAKTADVANA